MCNNIILNNDMPKDVSCEPKQTSFMLPVPTPHGSETRTINKIKFCNFPPSGAALPSFQRFLYFILFYFTPFQT